MTQPPDDTLLEEIEVLATNLAREAGAMLAAYFGRPLEVEYKDDKERDPVTAVDKESQEFIARGVAERFPDHGLLGEEGEEDSDPAPEFVWVVDPLDGTRNFICGLPVYACSIGVMHRGVPVAGAIFTPWPDQEDGGVVLHARRGGGAYLEGDAISVFQADEPKRNWLAALPGSFGAMYRFGKPMRGKVGEVRVAGSIAYELAMTARGVLQYSVTTGPRLWDVVAGAVLVTGGGRASDALAATTRAPWPVDANAPLGGRRVPRTLLGERDHHHEGPAKLVDSAGAGQPRGRALPHVQSE